jgi:hypothetical protein
VKNKETFMSMRNSDIENSEARKLFSMSPGTEKAQTIKYKESNDRQTGWLISHEDENDILNENKIK